MGKRTDKENLRKSIGQFEETTRRMGELVDGSLDERRKDLVQLRREMAEQFSQITALGDQVFTDPESRHAFRDWLSKARAAIALHQATWPVVRIDPGSPEYLATVVPMMDAQSEFVAWVRKALAR